MPKRRRRQPSVTLARMAMVPAGMTARYFAASLSAQHGDRLSNADIKTIAEEEFENNPKLAW